MHVACLENKKLCSQYYDVVTECREYRYFAHNIEHAWYQLLTTISNLENLKTRESKDLDERLPGWEQTREPFSTRIAHLNDCIKTNTLPDFAKKFADAVCVSLFENNKELRNQLRNMYFDCLKVVRFEINYKWSTKLVTTSQGYSNNLTVTHFSWESVRPYDYKKKFSNLEEQCMKLQDALHKEYVQKYTIKGVTFPKFKEKLEEENCAICLQSFHCKGNASKKRKRSDNPAVTLECGHILHKDCAIELSHRAFFKTSELHSLGKCPLCRMEL